MSMDRTAEAVDEDLYEALRRRGAGPITAIRIAAASAADQTDQATHIAYEQRTRKDLYARAKALGVAGRSSMTRDELISALRNR
jgi:hypothetical protein